MDTTQRSKLPRETTGQGVSKESTKRQEGDREAAWREFLTTIIDRWSLSSDRKQHRSKAREKEIMEAALRVFARDGIAKSRIGDIAAEAGVPQSALYDYFSGKQSIAHSVPIANLVDFFRQYAEIVQGKTTAYEKLHLYLWFAADYARKHPVWARVLYLEIWPSVLVEDSTLKECFDDYLRIILYLLREGEDYKEWPLIDDLYELSAIFVGGINQRIITRALYLRPRNISKAAESMVDRMLTLLNRYPQTG